MVQGAAGGGQVAGRFGQEAAVGGSSGWAEGEWGQQEAAGWGQSHMMEVKAGGQLPGSFPILLSLDQEDLTAAAFSAEPSTLADVGQLGISGWGHQM